MRAQPALLLIATIAAALALNAAGCSGLHVDEALVHHSSDWPMAGRTASGSYADSSQQLQLPPTLLWETDLSAGTGQGASIAVDNILLCSTLQGEMSVIDLATGNEIGSKKMNAPISGAPLCLGSDIVVCTEAGKETIFDYDLYHGEFKWRKNIGGVTASPILSQNRIFAGTLEGELFALNPTDGETIWHHATGAPVYSTPCADDSLIYCANTNGDVAALRMGTGAVVWKRILGGAVYGGLCVNRGIVYAGSRDHRLYALDARTGVIRWTYDCGDRIMAAAAASESLVVVSALNGSVTALTDTGTPRWKFSAKSAINTPAVITRDMVIVASLDTFVYALSLSDGVVVWKRSVDARIKTAPILWKGSLILIDDNRTIYRFVSK